MDTARTGKFGISASRITAYLAVLLLVGFVGWNLGNPPAQTIQNTAAHTATAIEPTDDALQALASSTDTTLPAGMTDLGASIVAQAVVAFDKASQQASSSDAGAAAVESFGASIKPPTQYKTYAASDIQTTPDTSKDRVINYRADLRTALAPLLDNKDMELDIFANYVDTKDPKYLDELRTTSQNYKLAIANTEKVVAPVDAASFQAAILTSMSEFSSVLDGLADNATDPYASSALLHTYVDAQDNMVASFNSIGKYAANKLL